MNFSFAEEQNLLRDSVQKFVQDEYEFEKRRQLVNSQENFSNAHLKKVFKGMFVQWSSKKKKKNTHTHFRYRKAYHENHYIW